MPLYIYKCPSCGKEEEHLVKNSSEVEYYCYDSTKHGNVALQMELTLSTPSAPQWRCSVGHSRSKGF